MQNLAKHPLLALNLSLVARGAFSCVKSFCRFLVFSQIRASLMLSLPAVSHPTTLTKIFPLFSTCVCCLVNIVIPFAMQMAPVMPSKQILRLSASPVCLLRPDQLHEHHAVLFCNFFLLCNDYHSYFSCSAHSYHLHCPFFGGKLDSITLYSIVRTKKLHSKCAWVCDLDLNKRKPQPPFRVGKVTGVICHPMQCV